MAQLGERGRRRGGQPQTAYLLAGSSDRLRYRAHGAGVPWAARGVAAWGNETFPSLPSAHTEQSAVCVNGNKRKHFQPRHLTQVCLPSGFAAFFG